MWAITWFKGSKIARSGTGVLIPIYIYDGYRCTHTPDIITYFRFTLDVPILINSTYSMRAATCGPLMMVAHTHTHTDARIIDYATQCTIPYYNVCKHNTHTLSSVCDINDGLTALCVSQQRPERDHTHIIIIAVDGLSRSYCRPDGLLCECFQYFYYCCYIIGCFVINDRRRVLCAHV